MRSERKKRKTSVWIVDDHDLYCKAVSVVVNETRDLTLERNFLSGKSLLESLAAETPPDVLLIDIEMPLMDGLQLLEIVRTRYPALKTIIVSAHDEEKNVYEALSRQATGFIVKSETAADIVTAIRAAARGGNPFDPFVMKKVLRLLPAHQQSGNTPLTVREQEIVRYAADGLTVKEIADRLRISVFTTQVHFKNIHSKLNVQTRGELVAKVIRQRLV